METVPAMADEPQDLRGHQVKPQKSAGSAHSRGRGVAKFAVRN